jgi:hypothetical protein
MASGGRYDGLAELLGGPPTPGIGFRTVRAADHQPKAAGGAAASA